jgi:hypothetical protein
VDQVVRRRALWVGHTRFRRSYRLLLFLVAPLGLCEEKGGTWTKASACGGLLDVVIGRDLE